MKETSLSSRTISGVIWIIEFSHMEPKSCSVAFAKDTRHQVRSRIFILQALYNAVDLIKEAFPKGSVFPK